MATLTAVEIYRICLDAGFSPDQAVTWTAIALAESGGDPTAHNPHGESSWGLWQVNVAPDVRTNAWGELTDPHANARAAYEISHGGTDLRPWTVTHASNGGTDHDYRQFMDEARAAAGGAHAGDFSGVTGYDDPSPGGSGPDVLGPATAPAATTTPVTPEAMAPPAAAGGADADHDGALDAFEMSSGTDPHRPDSDADGITDGFELLQGSDAGAVDSDGDGLSDGRELRLGTDAAAADSDHDGMSDGMELAAGRDPLHGVAVDGPGLAGGHGVAIDTDGDGLSDAWEASLGTDASSRDSDHDGVSDAFERVLGTNPLDPDSDHDGLLDHVDHDIDEDIDDDLASSVLGGEHGIDGAGLSALPGLGDAPVLPAVHATALDGLGEHAGPALLAGPVADAGAGAAGGTGVPVQHFLDAALAQTGDPYVWSSEAVATDADPDAFDCSELTQWAAAQVGVDLPDGSWLQYLELEQRGAVVPVEQALHTPGALLFNFSTEPSAAGARPAEAHVAISLGDGRTIEARGTRYGVGSWDAGSRFAYAAVMPELASADGSVPAVTLPPVDGDGGAVAAPAPAAVDADGDGVTDAFEMSSGTDPHLADSDGDGLTDGFEAVLGSDGTALDADGDGLSDAYEVRHGTAPLALDSDGDGLSDAMELAVGRDARFGVTLDLDLGHHDLALIDADGDGLSDAWEASLGSSPAAVDTDRDGLRDALEMVRNTDPDDPDTDDDGMVDRWDSFDDPEP
jgi:hypothetical protein